MRKIDTAIYDLDGTIADSLDLGVSIYGEARQNMSHLPYVSPSQYDELRQLNTLEVIKRLGVGFTDIFRLRKFANQRLRDRVDEIEPYPGMVKLIEDLATTELKQGIVTSADKYYAHEFIDRHFGAFTLDTVVTNGNIFLKRKSLGKAVRLLESSSESSVYIGDQQRDVVSAKKLGMASIGVTWGVASREGLEKVEPDYLVDDVDELGRAITNLAQK